LSIRAAQKPFGRSRRLLDFVVGANVTACRQIAKFFLPATFPPASYIARPTTPEKHSKQKPPFAP
jgi:hypothetical protein